MKTFTDFLTEERMSREYAMKVLGLSKGFTSADLKNAYRKKAMDNHPDRGGNDRTMQDVTVAYATLKADAAGPGSAAPESREDRDARRAAYAGLARETFNKHWNPHVFTDHFTAVFGEPIMLTVNEFKDNSRYGGLTEYYAAEWTNAARTIVLSLSVGINFESLYSGKIVLSSPETMFNMSISSEILYNRKKVKLSQRDWKFDARTAVLTDPNVTFPADKLKMQSAKSSTRKFSRRDAYLVMEKELRATISGDDVMVPVGPWRVRTYRTTFIGQAMWAISGVYEKYRMVAGTDYGNIFELEADFTQFADAMRALQANPPATPQALAAELNTILKNSKAQRGA
jgi:curved DNA-binding protein CbpA